MRKKPLQLVTFGRNKLIEEMLAVLFFNSGLHALMPGHFIVHVNVAGMPHLADLVKLFEVGEQDPPAGRRRHAQRAQLPEGKVVRGQWVHRAV